MESNVKLIDKILLYGSLIIFLKLYFFKKHWIQLQKSHFDRSDSITFFFFKTHWNLLCTVGIAY